MEHRFIVFGCKIRTRALKDLADCIILPKGVWQACVSLNLLKDFFFFSFANFSLFFLLYDTKKKNNNHKQRNVPKATVTQQAITASSAGLTQP